jgi:hypothetical protein
LRVAGFFAARFFPVAFRAVPGAFEATRFAVFLEGAFVAAFFAGDLTFFAGDLAAFFAVFFATAFLAGLRAVFLAATFDAAFLRRGIAFLTLATTDPNVRPTLVAILSRAEDAGALSGSPADSVEGGSDDGSPASSLTLCSIFALSSI